MSRVAVTGATGHIGANLVRALLADGRRVRALVRDDGRALDGLDVEAIPGDVRDAASLRRLFDGAEVVYHLAAVISIDGEQGGRVRATNVEGVRAAAEAALACGVRRFVHFSSVHAFDLTATGGAIDETAGRPTPKHPAYDRSKAAGEVALREVVARGLDAVVVHPSGVVGPWDFKPSRMGRLFLDLYRRRLPALVDGGFDWVDVRDVVAGAMAAEARGVTGESYLLTGAWRSLREVAARATEVTGVPAPRFDSPMWLARIGAPFMTFGNRLFGGEPLYTGEALHALRAAREISHARAARVLGYAPRPLAESVRAIYACFAARGLVELPAAPGADG